MYFCVNEFEVGVIDSIISGNKQQKVHLSIQDTAISCNKTALPRTALPRGPVRATYHGSSITS